MKDRLNEIIEKKGLTATKFAAMIDVNPSAISHLLKGRNKPGYDVLVNIARAFPDISMDWLLTGKGSMYTQAVERPSVFANTPEKKEKPIRQEEKESVSEKETAAVFQEAATVIPPVSVPHKTLKRIVLFFSDGSFEDYQKD